jgi:hypothetical protein
LELLVEHFSPKLRKPSKEILPSRKKKVCKSNLATVGAGIEDGVSHVAVANLFISYLGNVKSFFAVGTNEAKIDRWGCLELELDQLVSDIRELAVVLIAAVTEGRATEPMKSSPSVPLLVMTGVGKAGS